MIEKRTLLPLLFLALSVANSYAQDLRAEFAMARFNSPKDGPYLETYLKLKGASLRFNSNGDDRFSEVFISCIVTKGEDTVFIDTYKIQGPVKIKGEPALDFVDQQRIPMKSGKHTLKMILRDVNNPDGKEATITQDVVIQNKLGKVFLSDVELVDSYTETSTPNILSKAGYDLVPYTSGFFSESKNELRFYAEVYNTEKKIGTEQEFLINMFIENSDNGKIIGNLRKFIKRKGAKVVPVLSVFPLVDVGSGNYNLIIEARDRKNELLDRKTQFFQRSNPLESYVNPSESEIPDDLSGTFVGRYHRPEELKEYVRCLHPISTQQEITFVNRKTNFNDTEMMKQFLYNFWMQRNPENPEKAWLAYWKRVEKVNATYTTNYKKGYDTDRGRVYLQYGAPNTISPFYFEAETFPYEIWHYYRLEDHLNAPQSNRKFIFANISRGSAEFDLLHSDADNEINNRNWNYDLNRRPNAVIDIDQENGNDGFGSKSGEFFNNPY